MLTTSSSFSPIMISKMVPTPAACGAAASYVPQKYDSACFSEHTSGADSFFKNLVSRISQDVRTTTTTADIRCLRNSVQSGDYMPDPQTIASKMLLFVEE